MATFKEQAAIDLETVFYNTDEFAVEVIYTPKSGGSGQTIKAIVDYDVDQSRGAKGDEYEHVLTCERDVRSGFGTVVSRLVATVTIKTSDVAEPAYRDIITIDGLDFRVAEVFDHA